MVGMVLTLTFYDVLCIIIRSTGTSRSTRVLLQNKVDVWYLLWQLAAVGIAV